MKLLLSLKHSTNNNYIGGYDYNYFNPVCRGLYQITLLDSGLGFDCGLDWWRLLFL